MTDGLGDDFATRPLHSQERESTGNTTFGSNELNTQAYVVRNCYQAAETNRLSDLCEDVGATTVAGAPREVLDYTKASLLRPLNLAD